MHLDFWSNEAKVESKNCLSHRNLLKLHRWGICFTLVVLAMSLILAWIALSTFCSIFSLTTPTICSPSICKSEILVYLLLEVPTLSKYWYLSQLNNFYTSPAATPNAHSSQPLPYFLPHTHLHCPLPPTNPHVPLTPQIIFWYASNFRYRNHEDKSSKLFLMGCIYNSKLNLTKMPSQLELYSALIFTIGMWNLNFSNNDSPLFIVIKPTLPLQNMHQS